VTAISPTPQGARPIFFDIENGCDSHAHIVGPASEFPLNPDRSENPPPGSFDFWLDQYRHHLSQLGLTRGVLVQSILYGLDNSIISEALRRLGTESFRGVALVLNSVSETELDRLANSGFKGVRLNYVHGGAFDWDGAVGISDMLVDRGMHLQVLLYAHDHMEEFAEKLSQIKTEVVIDHMGWPDLRSGPDHSGFASLCRCLDTGRIWVKLSGLYRFCKSPFDAADVYARALIAANPERCLWGSDWPYLMLGDTAIPKTEALAKGLLRVTDSRAIRQQVLAENPASLFGW